jgi:choline dehydrogenase-like flavoprotein
MSGSPDRHSRRASVSLAALLEGTTKPPTFDVVIVGSGYGGSMAAAELAGAEVGPDGQRTRLQVCVLERGEEYLPGEFPADPGELPRHVRIGNQAGGTVAGFHEGLFDLRLGPDVAALVANGLGGGSLINAGVMLAPRREDFPKPGPLAGLIQSLHHGGWFQRASELLGSQNNTIRDHARFRDGEGEAREGAVPAKTAALDVLAGHRGSQYVPITVAMREGPNQAGIALPACTLCGDWMTGFNVRANATARASATQKGVDVRYYSIIYDLVDDIKKAASGLLKAEIRETFIGYATIKEVFKITGIGNVAGCLVTEGVARRSAGVRLLRDDVVIHEGTLKTLKRFKDEVKDVPMGQECGMAFERYEDIRSGDVIEIFEREEVQRTLA